MAAGFGNIPPFYTNYGPASATSPGFLTTGAQNLGGAKTWIIPHVDVLAENPLAMWRLDEDTGASIAFANGVSTNAAFVPSLVAISTSTRSGFIQRTDITTDSGGSACTVWNVRTVGSAAVSGRTILYEWENNGAAVLQAIPLNSGANAALSWGTQAGANPAFTTRAAGTRLVLSALIDGSHVDSAIGVDATNPNLWMSIPQANGTYNFYWYGGNTRIMTLVGTGVLTLTGPCQLKSYTVATLPASPAAGQIAYASDAAGNGPCIAMGNGSVWKRCDNTSTTVA